MKESRETTVSGKAAIKAAEESMLHYDRATAVMTTLLSNYRSNYNTPSTQTAMRAEYSTPEVYELVQRTMKRMGFKVEMENTTYSITAC